MNEVNLVWATPKIDDTIAYIARVSNPENQCNKKSIHKLIKYMMENGHVSPFEMASACVEVTTTRDIARQMLRHRSFSFQEFSQRYQDVSKIGAVFFTRECRLQDETNRQSSIECTVEPLIDEWEIRQQEVVSVAVEQYKWARNNGIAKEQARAVLPEGITPSRLYMAGNMRSWIHYLQSHLDKSTQKEHREIASKIKDILVTQAPITLSSFIGICNE